MKNSTSDSNSDNYSAFPVIAPDHGPIMTGLSKREYYAALAMQAILSNPEATRNRKEYGTAEYRVGVIAVQYADELIKQLEK